MLMESKYLIYKDKSIYTSRLNVLNSQVQDALTSKYSEYNQHQFKNLWAIPIVNGYENLFTEIELNSATDLPFDWYGTLVQRDEDNNILIPFVPETYIVPQQLKGEMCKFWKLTTKENAVDKTITFDVLALFFDADGNRTYINDTVNYLLVSNDNVIYGYGAYDLAQLTLDATLLNDAIVTMFDLDYSDYLQGKDSLIKRITE